MKFALICAFVSFLVSASVDAQANGLSSIGLGLLDSSHLSTGGLIFPNGDGTGPQASSLAAAIYGVAVPPGFDQFSASENFYGGASNNNPYAALSVANGVQPSELLQGLYGAGGGQSGGGGAPYSTFITDFSSFSNDFTKPSNDLSSSATNIDPIAARFGVVISENDNHGALFHPSLLGSSASPGTSSTGIVNRDATNEFLGVSPIQTTLHFKLPTQVSLPDFSSYEQFPVEPLKGNDITSDSGLGPLNFNTVGEIPVTSTKELFTPSHSSHTPPSILGHNNQADLITSAFKYSDEQLSKTEELNQSIRSFQEAMGKFNSPHSNFDLPKGKIISQLQDELNEDYLDEIGSIEVDDKKIDHEVHHHRPPPSLPAKKEEPKEVTKPAIELTTTSPSPYAYRGNNNRDRDRLSQATTTSAVLSREPVLPVPEALTAASTTETIQSTTKRINHRNPYGFILSPGYIKVTVPSE